MNIPNQNQLAGPNFCPNCGCNIKAIALSMAFASGQFLEPEAPKAPQAVAINSLARGITKSQEVARLYHEAKAQGKSMSDLAIELKMSTGTIGYHVNKAAGIVQKPKPKPPTPAFRPVIPTELKEEIHRRYKSGETPTEIAKSVGLKHTTVGSIIYKRNHAEKVEVAV